MLARCLDGVLQQTLPTGWRMSVLVVENNEEASELISVSSRQTPGGIRLYYFHERKLGIPFARNRALEEALKLGANWIAFIDDDETPDNVWLQELISAAETMDGDVFRGIVVQCYPKEATYPSPSEWTLPDLPAGFEFRSAATNNVMFRASLIEASGLGLRFDTNMRFSGGEDTEFFERANLRGARIRHVPTAIVHEDIPASKATLSYYLSTEARMASNVAYMKIKRHGIGSAFFKLLYRATKNVLRGTSRLVMTIPMTIFGSRMQFRQKLVDALSEFARAYGTMTYFSPLKMQPYKKVHGT